MSESISPQSPSGATSTARERAAIRDSGRQLEATSGSFLSTGWQRLLVPFLGHSAAFRLLARQRQTSLTDQVVITRSGPGMVRVRYAGPDGAGRDRCAALQTWAIDIAVRVGGSRVTLRDDTCVTRGDDACEYTVSWTDESGAAPAVVASLTATGLGGLASSFDAPVEMWALVPIAAAIAWAVDRRRLARSNRQARAAGGVAFRWLFDRAQATRRAASPAVSESSEPQPALNGTGSAAASIEIEPRDERLPSLQQEGEFWRVTYEGTTINLRHSRGLQLLAHLVRYAGRDLHVRELDAMTPAGGFAIAHEAPVATGHLAVAAGGEGETLDVRAQTEYRRRAAELRAELEQAEEWNDAGRAATIREELAQLIDHLRDAATSARRATDDGERLRSAITRRIRAAVMLIGKHHPSLGTHLERHVTTGYSCSYRPDAPSDAAPSVAKRTRARRR